MKRTIIYILAATAMITACKSKTEQAQHATDDNSQFVILTDAVPDAILEIRYYSTYNFVGTRIDGYEEPTAMLTRQAADSLRAVSDDVKQQGFRLKINRAVSRRVFFREAKNVTIGFKQIEACCHADTTS